jgi:hypothetical protein
MLATYGKNFVFGVPDNFLVLEKTPVIADNCYYKNGMLTLIVVVEI